jgi:hypothetical protein
MSLQPLYADNSTFLADKYEQEYGMPDPSSHYPGEKPPAYYLQKMQYYYSHLAHEHGSLVYAANNYGSSRRNYKELRDYGRGLQAVNKYLQQIGYSEQEIEKFRRDNISYQPLPIWPKFRNIIFSKFYDLNLSAQVKAQNDEANLERAFIKNRMKLVRQPETRMAAPPGTLPTDQHTELQTPDDVDFMFKIGGIQLPIEIGLKDDLDKTLEASDYKEIEKMILEDLVDMAGMAIDTRLVNDKLILDYVDFARIIVRSSIYPDFRDSDVRGYTAQRKVSELLLQDEAAIRENWDQLKEAYHGHVHFTNHYLYNQNIGFREDYMNYNQWRGNYSDFGVSVVKLYWVDTENHHFVVSKRYGRSRQFEPVQADFNLSERAMRAGKELQTVPIQSLYKCNWIPGTNIIFDYGKADTVVRPGQVGAKKLVWPLTIYAAQEPSLTEKVVPHIDSINIATYKKRDVISKIPPAPRMLIFKSMIKDTVKLGDEVYTLRDIVKNYYRDGIMVVDEMEEFTLPGEEITNRKDPIRFLPSGIEGELDSIETDIAMGIDKLRQISGINEVADGSGTAPDMLKSVIQGMQTATNNALRPWLERYIQFFKNFNSSLVWIYQLYRVAGLLPSDQLYNAYGQVIRQAGPDLLRYDLGLNVVVNDQTYLEFLMQDLMSKKEMIPPKVYFTIFNAINDKDVKKAEYFLIKASAEADQLAHTRQMEVAQATAEGNKAAAIAAEQERRQTLGMELEKDIQVMMREFELNELSRQNEHGRQKDMETHKGEIQRKISVETVRANNANRLNQ